MATARDVSRFRMNYWGRSAEVSPSTQQFPRAWLMHNPEDDDQVARIQRLCSRLTELVKLSAQQREELERLVNEAEALAKRIEDAKRSDRR